MTFDYEVVAEVCEGAISVLTGDIRTSEYSLNSLSVENRGRNKY